MFQVGQSSTGQSNFVRLEVVKFLPQTKCPGRPHLVSSCTVRLVERQVEKNPCITSQELKEKNPKLLGKVSDRTVSDFIFTMI